MGPSLPFLIFFALAQGHEISAPAAAPKAMPQVTNSPVADSPPPSTYDLEQKEHHGLTNEDSSIAWQLARMIFSLAVVVGLIFLVVRIGLPRLMRLRTVSAGGTLRVLERVQLDQRHAVALVEVYGSQRYLVGTSEHGVGLIARVDAQVEKSGEANDQGQGNAHR
jgi:flagellar biogenesis protein FliO